MAATTQCTNLDLPTSSSEETTHFQTLLNGMDPALLQGYRRFLHDALIEGVCHYNLTVHTFRRCLETSTKEVLDTFVEKAISFYDDQASPDIKSFGI